MNRGAWNILIAATLFVGTLFIVATRAQAEVVTTSPMRGAVATTPAPVVNHPAPDFRLQDLAGAPVQLADLRGQVVLINVWATWCPPCRAEMPAIQAVYGQLRDQGFTVLAVNVREDADQVRSFMTQHGLTFPALLDSNGAVSALYQSRVYPSSYFIDRAGLVRAVYRGPMSRSVIAGTVEQLLAEAP
jgi:peroxiredoxin